MAVLLDILLLAGGSFSLLVSIVGATCITWPADRVKLRSDRLYWRFMVMCTSFALISMAAGLAGRESTIVGYAVTGIVGLMLAVTLGASIAVLHQIKTRMRA